MVVNPLLKATSQVPVTGVTLHVGWGEPTLIVVVHSERGEARSRRHDGGASEVLWDSRREGDAENGAEGALRAVVPR